MTGTAVLVPTDLSRVTVLGSGPSGVWNAQGLPDDGDRLAAVRQRVSTAASFTSSHQSVRRRIGELIVDVDECECVWVRTASTTPAVIASTLRRQAEEWSGVMPIGGVHPLLTETPGGGRDGDGQQPETGVSVLTLPDAALRLYLDALDRAGVRVSRVSSLYHKLAQANTGRGMAATVLVEPGRRAVWAWSDAGRLVAAGRVALSTNEHSADDAARRLALDWGAWSAALSDAPSDVTLMTIDAGGPAGALGKRLGEITGLSVRTQTTTDPLASVADAAPPDATGASQLARLSQRPTRATRGRYLVTAAALIFAATAIAGIGWRLQSAAGERSDAATAERAELIEWAQAWGRDNGVQMSPSTPITAAFRDALQEAQQDTGSPEPPSPRPLTDVAREALAVLTDPAYDGVRLIEFKVGEATSGSSFALQNVDSAFATELIAAIESIESAVLWKRSTRRPGGDRRDFRGEWRQ